MGVVAGASGRRFFHPEPTAPKRTFSVLPPEGYIFGDMAVSPDTSRVAFTAVGANGRPRLWVRRMDSTEAHALPGTEGAALPFWSPDARSLGFFADRQLKRMTIDVESGRAQTLADAPDARGGAWNSDGVILFAPNIEDGLYRVPAGGGRVLRVTTPNRTNYENSHRWPQFLPDGRSFIFLARSSLSDKEGIYAATLDAPQPKLLLDTPYAASYARTLTGSQGYMLFLDRDVLFAQPFDPRQLRFFGERSALAHGIGVFTNRPYFSAPDDSMIAYQMGKAQTTALAWRDRSGAGIGPGLPVTLSNHLRISPDQLHVVAHDVDVQSGSGDIWVIDMERGTRRRLTSDRAYDWMPIWSPDGTRIAFASNRSGSMDLYHTATTGAESEKLLLKSPERKIPTDWAKDGRFLIYQQEGRNTNWDLWALPLEKDGKPVPLLQTEFDEVQGVVSPDGEWLAYSSNETGRFEVHVQSFRPSAKSKMSAKVPISVGGGVQPQWRSDGQELFYLSLDSTLKAVKVESTGPALKPGHPKSLFDTGLRNADFGIGQITYAPSRDGSRILMPVIDKLRSSPPITVVLNWSALMKP